MYNVRSCGYDWRNKGQRAGHFIEQVVLEVDGASSAVRRVVWDLHEDTRGRGWWPQRTSDGESATRGSSVGSARGKGNEQSSAFS
jgi:hypothetical protein